MRIIATFVVSCLVLFAATASAEEREDKIRADKQQFDKKREWIYNDLDRAYQRSESTGRPIMAVLRCIPCEECVKLDDDLINNDPAIAALMKQFVLVRLTGTNGLDLKTFQYDTDQSFAIFFLNADKVVYGRFGTRSHRTEWVTDVSVDGMARAMEGALDLHERYPSNRAQLTAKSNRPTEFPTPEKFPTLNRKPGRLDWKGRDFAKGVAKNCIHCHEISEARMELYWGKRKSIPEEVLFPYPHPKSVGLILDPQHRARVVEAVKDSPAAVAGLEAGDDILEMDGQPLISMADVQWVLHNVSPKGARVKLLVKRGEATQRLTLTLGSGWRRRDDTSWRTGHWILRRSMLGGMKLRNSAPNDVRAGARKRTTLKVEYVGNWGPFGVAQRAGVKKGDTIVSVDGVTSFRRESEVFEYINGKKRKGDIVRLVLNRGGKRVSVRYKID